MAGVVPDDLLTKFDNDGFAVIENFLSDDDVRELEKEIETLVKEEIPKAIRNPTIFTTDASYKHIQDNYFLESSDKIRIFFEDGAFDEQGRLAVDPSVSVNKIGHALHELNPVFKKVSTSPKVKEVAKKLEFLQPALCQSMFIFKQPKIGGQVTIHQDSTYLNTEPLGLVGFWFALEDATLENGCLWFIPGSHKVHPVSERFVRKEEEGRVLTEYRGAKLQVDDTMFQSAPVKKGSLVLIHGSVVHKSEKNLSDKSRHAYTFHIYEQHNTVYSPENWLQPTQKMPFPILYSLS